MRLIASFDWEFGSVPKWKLVAGDAEEAGLLRFAVFTDLCCTEGAVVDLNRTDGAVEKIGEGGRSTSKEGTNRYNVLTSWYCGYGCTGTYTTTINIH